MATRRNNLGWGPQQARTRRGIVLIAGLIVTQFILFGGSLVGGRVLLPLDILGQAGCYLSPSEQKAWGPPVDAANSDPVLCFELERRFAVAEIRAGRFPLWDPHEYCGAPFLAANQSSVLSPFRVMDYLWTGTRVIAWDQMLKAIVAGVGAYLFCRRALGAGFLAAVFGGWAWPVCGFYIQWAGAPVSAAATWLPWVFLFTDGVVREPWGLAGIGLAVVTGLALLSGHAETAGQELLGAGIFFVWRMFDFYGWKRLTSRGAAGSILAVVGGWGLGILLSGPQTLPTIDYLRTSHRFMARVAGEAGPETPSVGLKGVPQLVVPDFNGATRRGAYYFGGTGNLPESASTGYVGLVTALVLGPLAIGSHKYRRWVWFFLGLGILGLGQIVGIWPVKQLLEIFPLNLMRENRLVLWTGWAIAMIGVMGLEAIAEREFRWRGWFWIAAGGTGALAIWCLVRAGEYPENWEQYASAVGPEAGKTLQWFENVYLTGMALCVVGLIFWWGIWRGAFRYRWFVWTLAIFAVGEVIAMDYGVYPQGDAALYYPRQAMLEYLASAPAGRVCAVHCLPACLTEAYWLRDVRGYDAVDPGRLVNLLARTRPDLLGNSADEAGVLQEYFPAEFPSPITRMMNLRYLIIPGSPPVGQRARFAVEGYWLMEDANCLPRAFVPRHVEVVRDSARRLELLGSADFDPEDVAYVESDAPRFDGAARGTAKIVSEAPSHVTIEFDMGTPGVIVLSDLWDAGWKARVNGVETEVLRANEAFRGVVVPAGRGVLQFDYEPGSFYHGIWLALGAGISLGIWGWKRWRTVTR